MNLFSAHHLPALAAAVVKALSIYQMRRISLSGTYMVHDITSGDVLQTDLVHHGAQYGSLPLSDQLLTCLPLSIPRQYHQ